ncbi:hypothetical protein VIGAN_08201500 [Vigna angularis var. angularis]|uniref:VIN3-like fibronectin type-III domain-containing protein n=1 Tax=Vigna angularis var. angularis TaxID=157739 RepID=A0A0S3SR64_PHAAN|nr:hypothetical protein VIGAN_08201500 [Vigna angularis var. angularis]
MVTPLSISFSPPPMIHRATTTDHLPELHLAMIGHIHLSWSPKLIIGSDTKCREISFYFASHSHSSLPFVSSLSLAFLGTPHSHFSVFKIRAGRGHYCGWFSLALKQYEGCRLWHRASTTDYPEQPTFIVLRPEKRFKLENLHPSTEYFCKAFQNGLVKHTAAIQQQFDSTYSPLALTLRVCIEWLF